MKNRSTVFDIVLVALSLILVVSFFTINSDSIHEKLSWYVSGCHIPKSPTIEDVASYSEIGNHNCAAKIAEKRLQVQTQLTIAELQKAAYR